MRPISEQVDEFIQDYFSGNVITIIQKDVKGESKMVKFFGSRKGFKGGVPQTFAALFEELIPAYVNPSLKNRIQKQELALTIYTTVVKLRAIGLIQNNPDSLRELQFYKSRNHILEQQTSTLRDMIARTQLPPEKKNFKLSG